MSQVALSRATGRQLRGGVEGRGRGPRRCLAIACFQACSAEPLASCTGFPRDDRRLLADLGTVLTETPAVALLGPRQVGKTTHALPESGQDVAVSLLRPGIRERPRESR